MMETVTAAGRHGAPYAWIANYGVAGKTGTAHKATAGGYSKNNYSSAFAGIVPAIQPASGGGGCRRQSEKRQLLRRRWFPVPVFSKVMDGALRLLDVPPDNIGRWYVGGPLQGQSGLTGSKPPTVETVR